MAYTIWSNLTLDDQEEIIRRYQAGESTDDLSQAYNLRSESLGRKLRSLSAQSQKVLDFVFYDLVVDKDSRVFVYSDTHFGEHDPLAVQAALTVAERYDPHIIINLGDTVDASRLSRFKKDPRSTSIQEERDLWYDFAEQLNDVTRATTKIMVIGNHDLRYVSTLLETGGLIDMPELSFKSFFYTEELGYENPVDMVYLNRQGDENSPNALAYLMHGEFARKGSGSSVRAASEMFSGANTVVGHAHRTAFVTKRTMRGLVAGYEIGTLARLSPSYSFFPDWSQSVATGVFGKDFIVLTHHIIQSGEVVIDGKRYLVKR
jgi:predicted phosphodiesterase